MSVRTSFSMIAASALVTGAMGAAFFANATEASAAGCSNRLFQVAGYKDGEAGNVFKGQPQVPGWEAELFSYSDGIFPVVDPQTLDVTVQRAVPSLEKKAVDYHQKCPNAKIAFHGYSFGALIAGNVVESLAKKQVIPHKQLNAVLYGDPRRTPQNKGDEGLAGGILTMLPNLPGITAPGPRNTGDIDVSQVCKQNDVICNAANPVTNAAALINEIQGYLIPPPNSDHGYAMNPYGPHSNPGDHYIKQPPRSPYGKPLNFPFPVPTPNQALNGNKAWNDMIAAMSNVVNPIQWAKLLNQRGIPGDLVLSPLRPWLEQSGVRV